MDTETEQHVCSQSWSQRGVSWKWFGSAPVISWLLARHMLLQGAQIIYFTVIALYCTAHADNKIIIYPPPTMHYCIQSNLVNEA